MNNIIIEEARVGISKGGFACGPVPGHVVVEARIRKEDGAVSFYGLVDVDGSPNFYETQESRYEKEISEDFNENESFPEAEAFYDYDEFDEAVQKIEDEAHALLLKYLVCLAMLDWDKTEQLRQISVGKALGSFDLPNYDEE